MDGTMDDKIGTHNDSDSDDADLSVQHDTVSFFVLYSYLLT